MKMYHGANLLPENLETGEYKVGGTAEINDLQPWYIVAYAEDTFGHKYNGIFSGIQFYGYSDVEILRRFFNTNYTCWKNRQNIKHFYCSKTCFLP